MRVFGGDTGLLLAGTVMDRLGLEAMLDEVVRPPGRGEGVVVGGVDACGGLVHRRRAAAVVGVDGSGAAVWGVGAVDSGNVLRSFTFGHLRQFDRAQELALDRAWSVGAAPQVSEMTLDLDSTICEVHSHHKHGAADGHTKVLGYHPLVAERDDTAELMHSRMRSGSSQSGYARFVSESLARTRRLTPDAVKLWQQPYVDLLSQMRTTQSR